MGDENGNGGKKKRNLSPETRERLRQAALQRHAEGKLGGAQFGKLGGRPKKDRASKHVAEAAQQEENRQALVQVFKDAIDDRQPMGTRLKGAELWLKVEHEEAKVSLQEEAHQALDKSRDELIAILAEKLTNGPTGKIIGAQLEQEVIADAEVVEDEDGDSAEAA